jgi:peroxiredoxin
MNEAPQTPAPDKKSRLLLALRNSTVVALFIIGIAGAWVLGSRVTDTQTRAGIQVGLIAPDFALPALDGQVVTLSSQRGNVVLINMWASWCVPCRTEMPAIAQVYARYRDSGFVVLGLNATYQDNEVNARSFVISQRLTFPILLDRSGQTSATYKLRSLPTSYILGRDGIIRHIVVGAMTEAMLEARVKQLLAGGR